MKLKRGKGHPKTPHFKKYCEMCQYLKYNCEDYDPVSDMGTCNGQIIIVALVMHSVIVNILICTDTDTRYQSD